MRLENRTTIITGVGRDLGKGIALKLAVEGAKVIIADMSMGTAPAAAEGINASNGIARAFAINIAKQDEVKAMMDFIVESFGMLDVIVNNVGINRGAMLHKMTMEQWDQVVAVNLTGTFHCVQYVAQIMREKGSGAIINISSASWLGGIRQANYTTSKADVVGLARTTYHGLARRGVTCNAICPGLIGTDMIRGIPEKIWDTVISKIPMGRTGSPAGVANIVAFLASNGANYITGEIVNVGGGMIL